MEDLPTPLSRVELYLAKACGMDVTVPEAPLSRLEQFLAVIAGDTSVELPTPYSLTEMWLAFVAGITPDPLLEVIGAHYIDNQKVDTRYLAVASGMDGVTLPAAPQNRKEQYWAYIAGNAPIHGVLKYVTGSSFTLTDVVSGIEELQYVYGDTTQQTYSGKNLFDKVAATNSSAVYWLNDDGSISTSVTNGGGRQYMTISLGAGSYTLSYILYLSGLSGNNIRITVRNMDSSTFLYEGWNYGAVNGRKYSCNFTVSEASNIGICICPQNTIPTGGSFSFDETQIESGSSATSYEPYVGGTPSPNPDYPQDINVVTGEQTVTVTGKNMWNFDTNTENWQSTPTVLTTNSMRLTGTTNSGGQYARFVIPCEPSTTYVLSRDVNIVTAGANDSGMIYIQDNNGYITNLGINGSSKSFTTSATANQIRLVFYAQISGTPSEAPVVEFSNVQVEKGSTATPYESYQSTTKTVDLGSIELCKIGTYQDYIYKSGDDWYVHKATGKVVLDGSEGYWGRNSGNTFYYQSFSDMKVITPSSAVSPLVSNYYIGCSQDDLANATVDYGIALRSSTNGLAVRNKDVTGENAIKNWFQSNNTTVYYALATPTDTKITDSTLIGELEGLESLVLPKPTAIGTITATGTNLPMPIKFSYYGSSEE